MAMAVHFRVDGDGSALSEGERAIKTPNIFCCGGKYRQNLVWILSIVAGTIDSGVVHTECSIEHATQNLQN